MPQPLRAASYWALAVVFVAVYVGSLFSPALLDDADSTHAEAAREMFVSGDYVTLHVNGVRYLEKAPLPYWMVAFCYHIFGVNEFASRLPMALSVLLLGVLAVAWGRRAFGERAGIYAGLLVYTSAGVFLFTRVLIPDVLLSLLIAASLYFFLNALERDGHAWQWYAGYACVALGVLTKGLIALAFPGGAAFLYLAVTGEWRRWREFRLASGLALFLLIAAPWHILAGLRNTGGQGGHGFFWFYFVNEHFLRFLGRRYPRDYNKLPWALYWSLHLVWLFPWSLYLPAAIRTIIDERRAPRRSDVGARTRLLCWTLSGVVLVFFAISTNQEYYTFPAYFPLLMLLADGIAQCEWSDCGLGVRKGWLRISAGALAVVGLAASATLLTLLWQSRHLPFEPDIGIVLAKHNMDTDTLSTSHVLDLSYASFAALRLPAALAAVALMMAPLLSFLLRIWRTTLRSDVGTGGGHGDFSGGGAYCAGTIWAVFVVEGFGARDCGAGAARGSSDDLWRSGLWIVAAVLFATAGGTGGRADDFDVVWVDVPGCSENLFERCGFTAVLDWTGAGVLVCAPASESEGGCAFAEQGRGCGDFGEVCLQQPSLRHLVRAVTLWG